MSPEFLSALEKTTGAVLDHLVTFEVLEHNDWFTCRCTAIRGVSVVGGDVGIMVAGRKDLIQVAETYIQSSGAVSSLLMKALVRGGVVDIDKIIAGAEA